MNAQLHILSGELVPEPQYMGNPIVVAAIYGASALGTVIFSAVKGKKEVDAARKIAQSVEEEERAYLLNLNKETITQYIENKAVQKKALNVTMAVVAAGVGYMLIKRSKKS